ncbi:NB-ARC domain-containing protein [Dactylosporangium sp. NBC_01737]|uniref:NB-ARC domain-containing protein n=1 Tax=Dactylosporangium sp. NBC_01737 TaxID=2975959 RepID=UPI003FA3805F
MRAFAGRAGELAGLDKLVTGDGDGQAVVAVVTGTAGVGKSALVVHWAHRAAEHFPDGQLYVNLRGFDPGGRPVDPADAVRGFLEAFGVAAERIPADLAAQAALLRSLLAGRRVLIVLDNARDAAQVRPLLPGTPGCLAVVTSRDALTSLVVLEGAVGVTVDLLSDGEAADLLVRRLGAARVAAEPAAVAEIVTRCARLPLALAVVAGRAATRPELPLADLAASLRAAGTLDAIAGDDPVCDPRAVFSWSYRALRPPAAELLRRFSLAPGPDLGADAIASLAGVPAARPAHPRRAAAGQPPRRAHPRPVLPARPAARVRRRAGRRARRRARLPARRAPAARSLPAHRRRGGAAARPDPGRRAARRPAARHRRAPARRPRRGPRLVRRRAAPAAGRGPRRRRRRSRRAHVAPGGGDDHVPGPARPVARPGRHPGGGAACPAACRGPYRPRRRRVRARPDVRADRPLRGRRAPSRRRHVGP